MVCVGYPNRVEAVNPRKMNLTVTVKVFSDVEAQVKVWVVAEK